MSYDPQNIFARIIAELIPCNKVYEDANTLAFYDIAPKAPVHILVVPKGPYMDFEDYVAHAPAQEISGFFQTVSKLAQELGIAESGYRLITNKGEHSGQEVPHFHVHLLGGAPLPLW